MCGIYEIGTFIGVRGREPNTIPILWGLDKYTVAQPNH
jgi:hypothetical protein